MIVILIIGTLGRVVSFTPEVGALESQVLSALEPLRSGLALTAAAFLHGLFTAPWVYGVIAVLAGWLALVRRHRRDAAGFAVTAVTAVLVASAVQQIVDRPAPGAADAVLAAETAASLPSVAVCSALAITLAFLVASSRRHVSGMLILIVGGGLSLLTAAAELLGSSAYILDVVLSVPVAWAGVVIGCGIANRTVPALAELLGWDVSRAERRISRREAPRFSDAETAVAPRAARPSQALLDDDGPITEEIPVIREDDVAA